MAESNKKVTDISEMLIIRSLASILTERSMLLSKLGKSYGTDRDMYKALGYPKSVSFESYQARYSRQDIAKRVVTAYPKACWRKKPEISEGLEDADQTEFEKAWSDLVRQRKLWHYLAKADRISGIGRFGVLLLGFDDGKPFDLPLQGKNNKLIYTQAYHEGSVSVKKLVTDSSSPMYGMPETYAVKMASDISGESASTTTKIVHWSRVIHVAEESDGADIYGTPRLKAVYNRLIDLERVAGGSSEMFWRGAFPGFAFVADKDARFGKQEREALEDEIQDYMHKLRRYLRLKGMSVESLEVQVADPSKHFDILVTLIAAATNIPKRILLGSERGELASSQDERNFKESVAERCTDHLEPNIIRPFIDRLIEYGALPEPKDGYEVKWPDLSTHTAKDDAEVGKMKTEALNKYVNTAGADMILPPQMFLSKILGFTQKEIEQANDMLLEEQGKGIGEGEEEEGIEE